MTTPALVDLRSDTVTRPSPGMRAAMAAAEVGDAVLGDDPTVLRLQERAAELLGQEAALYVPSGTMANQIALKVHCEPGDDVLACEGAHLMWYESGAAGAIAGVQIRSIGRAGRFSAADVEAAYVEAQPTIPATRLVCVENTHNRSGGVVWPRANVDEVVATARACSTRRPSSACRRTSSPGPSTRSLCVSRRGWARPWARSSRARARSWRARCASGACSAAGCASRA